MEPRIQIDKVEPKAFEGMLSLEKYLRQSSLQKSHIELIKMRASQINRCAFCIDMHTKDALENGEDPKRIFQLNAWQESGLFTGEEQVLLKMTEEITLIHQNGLTPETYQNAMNVFDENYFAQIVMAITTINAWNRISVSTHKPIES